MTADELKLAENILEEATRTYKIVELLSEVLGKMVGEIPDSEDEEYYEYSQNAAMNGDSLHTLLEDVEHWNNIVYR